METFEEKTLQGGNLPKTAKTVSFEVASFDKTLFELGSLANESHDVPQVKTTKHKKETHLFYDVQDRHSQAEMAVGTKMSINFVIIVHFVVISLRMIELIKYHIYMTNYGLCILVIIIYINKGI